MSSVPPAVWVRGLDKAYQRRSHKLDVLQNLNMTVQAGSIYGLLGPSGCGKTTLLRCLVGRLNYEQGEIIVLGDHPGAPGHGIPGSMVGYMPQDLALYPEFSISNTLYYFGRLHGMTTHNIQRRLAFLIDFLSLPSKNKLIKELSGGQKRRVSFCAALLQEPALLILDEPTVGVDPVLREKIWEHLIQISQSSRQTTIIVTTHYIEEARQAHKVGLMRSGHLLAEAPPQELIDRFNETTLENVFLKLCQLDQDRNLEENVSTSYGSSNNKQTPYTSVDTSYMSIEESGNSRNVLPVENGPASFTNPEMDEENSPLLLNTSTQHRKAKGERSKMKRVSRLCTYPKMSRFLAILVKNLTIMKRNLAFLLFSFMLPSIQIILFCLCVGPDPYDLSIAIVNSDTGPLHLGTSFIQHLDNYTIHKIARDNMSSAVDMVKQGEAWGAIEMRQNFSIDLMLRFASQNITNETIEGSKIHVRLDMTNQQIAISIQAKIMSAFQAFAAEALSKYGMSPSLAESPVQFEDPVYGSMNPEFTTFMAPAIILSITFFMATGLTALSFVTEKKEGLLDRSQVAGVQMFEVMFAHICTQFLVMAAQVTLMLVFTLAVFKVPCEGPLIWVIILTLLEGFSGMTLGLVISAICDREQTATQLSLATMYPMLLLSGIIWPIQAIPRWLYYISICLPMTLAAESMRALLGRGWDITYMVVWRGYLISIGWSMSLMLIAAIILRIRH